MLHTIKKVYVINLEHRKDRKKYMMAKIQEMGIAKHKIKFIKATDRSEQSWLEALYEIGLLKNEDPLTVNVHDFISDKYNKILNGDDEVVKKRIKGIIGNFFSHLRVWCLIAKEKTFNSFLILEDDIIHTKYWDSIASNNLYSKIQYLPLIFLGDCWRKNIKSKLALPDIYEDESQKSPKRSISPRKSLRKSPKKSPKQRLVSYWTQCLHAYLVTTQFGLLIKGSFDKIFPMNVPSDQWLPDFLIKYNIPFYIYDKSIIIQNNDLGTDIQFF